MSACFLRYSRYIMQNSYILLLRHLTKAGNAPLNFALNLHYIKCTPHYNNKVHYILRSFICLFIFVSLLLISWHLSRSSVTHSQARLFQQISTNWRGILKKLSSNITSLKKLKICHISFAEKSNIWYVGETLCWAEQGAIQWC